MYDDQHHQHENITDPLDEFLAQLLSDIPDVLPTPIITPRSASVFAPASTSPFPSSSAAAAAAATTPYYMPSSHLSCQWVSSHDLPIVCGAPLSSDPKYTCNHFRHVHHIHGNEKVTVQCHWRDCHVPLMQRGSLIRHVLTVHLGLLRWQCEACGRKFARKGTAHTCVEEGG